MAETPTKDYFMLAIVAYILCFPLGAVALYYSSEVGMCVVSVLTFPSLSILALTLNKLYPCPPSCFFRSYPVHPQTHGSPLFNNPF